MKLPKFLVGLLIGGLLGIIYWYWQKSTSAEDGALDLLHRMAASDRRLLEMEERLRSDSPEITAPASQVQTVPAEVDDLQVISGIGPAYAARLNEAGVLTLGDLAACSASDLMEITGRRSLPAVTAWIREAQARGG